MATGLHEFLTRFKSLLHRRRLDRDLADELEFHQAMIREKLVREGAAPQQVEAATRKRFGNPARWQERLRELWQIQPLENLFRDITFSWRRLRKSPGFTSIALLTLLLGVGANTAIFSLINGLLLRPLPVPHADQLVVLNMAEGGPQPNYSFPTPFFRQLEQQSSIFSDVFAYDGDRLQVHGPSGVESIRGMLVSGQFFRALQTPPLLGRYLTPQDDRSGGNPAGFAVVISEQFWQHWFNRDPNVIGRKLIIANVPFTVAGVMPKRFFGAEPTQRPEIYVPLSAEPIIDAPRHNVDEGLHAWWLTVIARLQPGMNLDQANAALRTVSGPILHSAPGDPDYVAAEDKAHFHFVAEHASGGFTYARFLFRKPLMAIFSMCIGILLLACLNLAGLLMARGTMRERELATRLAMGATRPRLVRQLFVESLMIAVLGTVAGILVAPAVSSSLAAFLMSSSGDRNLVLDTSLDIRVLVFAVLIAIVSAVMIGLAPALQATSGNLNDHIKDGQYSRHSHPRRFLPRVLMSVEVALALVLVVGAGLLATSLVRLYRTGVGFDPKGLVNISFSMDKQPLEGDALLRTYQQLDEGLSRQPGVQSVSLQFIVPLTHLGWNGNYSTAGGVHHLIWLNSVGPDYFKTMRIPLYTGREFRWNDTKASGLKIILNQAAAKLFFPGRNALGQQIVNPREKTSYQVVAIVGDAKYKDMLEPATPTGYIPVLQDEQKKPSLTAVVRIDGPTAPLAAAARALTTRLAPTIPAPVITSMDSVINDSISSERMMALLSVFFAACALLITAIGLYGTLAYATARRTSEIGIRMALGAQRAQVAALVFRENAWIAAAGLFTGVAAAFLASRALASFLYDTSARNPWVMLASALLLGIVAAAASLIPAVRAARIEPITAIRHE